MPEVADRVHEGVVDGAGLGGAADGEMEGNVSLLNISLRLMMNEGTSVTRATLHRRYLAEVFWASSFFRDLTSIFFVCFACELREL